MPQEAVLIIFQILVLVAAFSVHECAHAWAAWRLGDPTAYMLGRVTLNPARHLDPFGSLVFPLIALISHFPLIGWAKPCPVTPRNFRHAKRDDILTTLAGPASNLLMALLALLLLLVFKHLVAGGEAALFSAMAIASRVPDVDTTHLPSIFPLALLLYYAILTNLLLFIFNLIPVPPLDGSRILRYFLPYRAEQIYNRFGMYGMIFVFFVGGRIIFGLFYFPLLNGFDHLLAAL